MTTTTQDIVEAITSMDLQEVESEQFEANDLSEEELVDVQVAQTMDIHALEDQVKQLKVLLTNERMRVSKQAQAMQANIRQLQGNLTATELRAGSYEKTAIDANIKLSNMKSVLNIAKQDLKTARKTIAHVQATQEERIEAVEQSANAA